MQIFQHDNYVKIILKQEEIIKSYKLPFLKKDFKNLNQHEIEYMTKVILDDIYSSNNFTFTSDQVPTHLTINQDTVEVICYGVTATDGVDVIEENNVDDMSPIPMELLQTFGEEILGLLAADGLLDYDEEDDENEEADTCVTALYRFHNIYEASEFASITNLTGIKNIKGSLIKYDGHIYLYLQGISESVHLKLDSVAYSISKMTQNNNLSIVMEHGEEIEIDDVINKLVSL